MLRQFVHYQSREPAQALRTRKIRPAWEAIAEFLTTCTNALAPESATLELYEATRFDTPYRVEPFLEKLAELFGPAERQQWGPDVSGDGRYEWALSGSQIEQARDFIAAQSWPKSIIGPVNLVVSHYFLWIDPTSRLPLPFQDPKYLVPLWKPQSHLLVWLGPRNRAFADWRFPFETIDADCRRYLDGVKSAAPISLSGKHFHLLIPNKGGTDYAVRKISPAAMDGL